MLEALEVVNEKTDAGALGTKAGLIEQHPERRFKAAFNAYLERELPKLKEDVSDFEERSWPVVRGHASPILGGG